MPSRAHKGGKEVSRASFSVVAALFLLFSTSVAVGVAQHLHQISLGRSMAHLKPKYLVMLVLDGGRADYLHVGSLPHLDALRQAGVEYDRAWAGILESETPAGHATLSTGSTPAHDGLLGFNWIRGDSEPGRLFDPNVVRQGAIERVMQQAGAPSIAGLFKTRYPKAKVVAVSGHKYYAADPLGGPQADYILYYAPDAKNAYVPTAIPGHVPPSSVLTAAGLTYPSTTMPPGMEDRLAVKLALASFRQVHQQVSLINLPEFDWPLGHVYGTDLRRTQTLMRNFDQDLGLIEDTYRKAGVLDRTVFVVTSDHGMTPLKAIVPDTVLDDAVTQAGTTAPETTYSTAGYVWLQNPGIARTVAGNVLAKKNPYVQSVYYKVTTNGVDSYLHAGGLPISSGVDHANQYLLKSFLGGNAPDVVAFCVENVSFEKKDAESWKGNHGGGAWESQHVPLVMAGPGIASGVVSHAPARLEDIAPTTLALFGIRASGMDGNVLADALAAPTSSEKRTQAVLSDSLNPLVQALSSQPSVAPSSQR